MPYASADEDDPTIKVITYNAPPRVLITVADGIVSSISDSEDIDIRILDHDDNPEVTAPRQFKSIVSRKRYPITIRAPEPAADRCRIAEGLPEAYHWLERHPEDLSCGA